MIYMMLPDYIGFDESLENLGPLEGWAQEREYHPSWVVVEAFPGGDSEAFSKKTAAQRCAEGMPVYLFWEKNSTRDLSSIAVYFWDQRRDEIDEDTLLGYLPVDIAENCLSDYLAGEKRFAGLIKKIFIPSTGEPEVYLEIVAYYHPESRKGSTRKKREDCKKWWAENVRTFFSMCTPLPVEKIEALDKAGMLNPEKLTGANNMDILAIPGIDRIALNIIRKHYPRKVPKFPSSG